MNVLLYTAPALKDFRSLSFQMSSVDYDLTEIITLIMDAVSNQITAQAKIDYLVSSYQTYGSFEGKVTSDGLVLSSAVSNLAMAIQKAAMDMKLYDQSGYLMYLFDRLLNDNIILRPRN